METEQRLNQYFLNKTKILPHFYINATSATFSYIHYFLLNWETYLNIDCLTVSVDAGNTLFYLLVLQNFPQHRGMFFIIVGISLLHYFLVVALTQDLSSDSWKSIAWIITEQKPCMSDGKFWYEDFHVKLKFLFSRSSCMSSFSYIYIFLFSVRSTLKFI